MDNKQQRGSARTQRPERTQVQMQLLALEHLVEADHRVRLVWQYVESLDLSEFYASFKATSDTVGRSPIDPQILLALWLYATLEGIGSARKIAKRTTDTIPFIWICGGVSVNYHTLADFRSSNGDLFENLMIQSIAVLIDQDLIPLDTIAQDGMRVRASAGTSSMRRKPSLEKLLKKTQDHCERLKNQAESDDLSKRQNAARQRAAEEKARRVKQAIEELKRINAGREKYNRTTEKTRSSTTDPEARRMKMANGGFNPAFNVQFATDGECRVIVGVDITNSGGDGGLMSAMHEKIVTDYGRVPKEYLVDGPYATREDITQLELAGTEVLAPIPMKSKMEKKGTDPHARQSRDTDEMFAFRKRMATQASKDRFKLRPSIAEFPNADCRNRGLQQFVVRGLKRAKGQAMLHVHAYNFMRFLNLGFLDSLKGAK